MKKQKQTKKLNYKIKGLSKRKSARKTIKKTDPQKQFLIFRSPKTGKIVKYKSKVNLLVEVRSKKTKKLLGYLNDFESQTKPGQVKQIKPRKFSKLQVALKSRREEMRQITVSDQYSFEVRFNELLIDQVKAQQQIFKPIKKEIRKIGVKTIAVEVFARNDAFFDGHKVYTKKDTEGDYLEKEIAIRIIQLLRSEAVRTSPKKEATKAGKKPKGNIYYQKAQVVLSLGDI